MNPKQAVYLIKADWDRQRAEAWRELHRRPDAPPLPPEPEPGPSIVARLSAFVRRRPAAAQVPAPVPVPVPPGRRSTEAARR